MVKYFLSDQCKICNQGSKHLESILCQSNFQAILCLQHCRSAALSWSYGIHQDRCSLVLIIPVLNALITDLFHTKLRLCCPNWAAAWSTRACYFFFRAKQRYWRNAHLNIELLISLVGKNELSACMLFNCIGYQTRWLRRSVCVLQCGRLDWQFFIF